MRCPRDGAHLSPVSIDGVQMDQCPTCKGLWLDMGELEATWKLNEESIEDDLRPPANAGQDDDDGAVAYMRCPKCADGRLQSVDYSYLRPIRIDRCNQCLGVWLDKGELDAIAAEKQQLDEEFSVERLKRVLQSDLG